MGEIDVIPLFLLLGVNHCQPLIHMSKILFFIYTREKQINPFENWLYC